MSKVNKEWLAKQIADYLDQYNKEKISMFDLITYIEEMVLDFSEKPND